MYLHDTIIFFYDADEQLLHLRAILSFLSKAGVILNLKKYSFSTKRVGQLGHAIRLGKSELADHTTDVIQGQKPTCNVADLKYFLQLCNVFRQFVPNPSLKAALLNNTLERGTKEHLTPLHQKRTTHNRH